MGCTGFSTIQEVAHFFSHPQSGNPPHLISGLVTSALVAFRLEDCAQNKWAGLTQIQVGKKNARSLASLAKRLGNTQYIKYEVRKKLPEHHDYILVNAQTLELNHIFERECDISE